MTAIAEVYMVLFLVTLTLLVAACITAHLEINKLVREKGHLEAHASDLCRDIELLRYRLDTISEGKLAYIRQPVIPVAEEWARGAS